MKTLTRLFLCAMALTALLPAGRAQDKKYRFEVFGGVSRPVEKRFIIGFPQSAAPISGTQEFSWGGQGGVRIGIDGHRHWGQDYWYSFSSNAGRIITPYGRFAYTNRVHNAATNVLFYPWSLEKHQVLPFVTAGLGAAFVTLSQETISEALDPLRAGIGPIKSETVFVVNAGAGIRVRLSERFGIRIDARDFISRPLRYGLPKNSSDPNAAVLPVSGAFHQPAGSFALVVHF